MIAHRAEQRWATVGKILGGMRAQDLKTLLSRAHLAGFLGWTRSKDGSRDFYVRQLRDMKISVIIEGWDVDMLRTYGRLRGRALAHAHARSGDAAMISGYMGSSGIFDDAICEFATEYADHNERDYRVFVRAVREGQVQFLIEEP